MLHKHVVETELLYFYEWARRLMTTHADIVRVCTQENGPSLSHPEWELGGKLAVV